MAVDAVDGDGDGSRSGFWPRPSWWVDAAGRDATDDARDDQARERDRVAAERDRAAGERDEAAAQREWEATELVTAAHDRYDTGSVSDAATLAQAELLRGDEATVAQARLNVLGAHPVVAAALARMQNHIDDLYAALLNAGVQREQARADLRVIAQHVAAASADRRAAAQDRGHAHTDRAHGRADRDNAATSRQQAAITRAPRSNDL